MSATRTFAVLKSSAFISGDAWSVAVAEAARQNADIAAYLGGHFDLGGDENGILSAAYVAVNGAVTFDLNGDTLGGLTLEAVLFYYTAAAATTVNVRVRNTTDASDAATLAAPSAATTVTRTVRTMTMASGVKTYQLQVTGSDALNAVYAWGYLRLQKVAA